MLSFLHHVLKVKSKANNMIQERQPLQGEALLIKNNEAREVNLVSRRLLFIKVVALGGLMKLYKF